MAKKVKSRQVKTTLEGFALWAIERYTNLSGKKESPAVAALIDRWLEMDSAYLEKYEITLKNYWKAEGKEPDPELEAEARNDRRRRRQTKAEPEKPN